MDLEHLRGELIKTVEKIRALPLEGMKEDIMNAYRKVVDSMLNVDSVTGEMNCMLMLLMQSDIKNIHTIKKQLDL